MSRPADVVSVELEPIQFATVRYWGHACWPAGYWANGYWGTDWNVQTVEFSVGFAFELDFPVEEAE